MKIAVTGCSGSVGTRVVLLSIAQGHDVVGIDSKPPDFVKQSSSFKSERFKFTQADLREYESALDSLRGCDAVVHLAAYRNPGDYVATTHNSNVVISWNVLRSAAELGITRVAQASSVNIVNMVYSRGPKFHYFPIDEDHPLEPDEPYGLSKQIAELQADTLVRRYPSMRIASLRLHWSIPDRTPISKRRTEISMAKNDLWGYVQEDRSAEAFLLALSPENDAKWKGHEPFFICAPDTTWNGPTSELYEAFWSDVPIKEGNNLDGRKGFFDCSKAERLLGWKHPEAVI